MSRSTRTFTLALLGLAVMLPGTDGETQTQLAIAVDTDRAQYLAGEPVQVSVRVCNPTAGSVSESYTPPCDSEQFRVVPEAGGGEVAYSDFGPYCLPFNPTVELGPGECEVIVSWQWPQCAGGAPLPATGTQVAPGTYLVLADFLGEVTPSAPFEILGLQQPAAIPVLGPVGWGVLTVAVAFLGALLARRWTTV